MPASKKPVKQSNYLAMKIESCAGAIETPTAADFNIRIRPPQAVMGIRHETLVAPPIPLKKQRIHVADLRTSKRLQKVFRFLYGRGKYGATGIEIVTKLHIVGLSDAIWELRNQSDDTGFKIACLPEGLSRNGSKINRFTLDMRFTREQRARLGWMAK